MPSTYHIEHHSSEDFLVYQESSLQLTVRRKRGWDGVLRSEFFLGERRILAASLSEIFWTWKLKITFADPEYPIAPEGKGVEKFRMPEGVIEVKRRALSNPVITFCLNGEVAGQANMNLRKAEAPFEYDVFLDCQPETGLFFILAMILSESGMAG